MKWRSDAEKALGRVPFFVRKRVKKRVEEEAARSGAREVTMAHVTACQKRFLDRMQEEVKGFQVETCFGPGGCPNRAVISDGLPEELEKRLSRRNLKAFLEERVGGPLKMHHEFRVSVADCPNACSRPQIADVGFIGASRPMISDEPCSQCMACLEACKEGAISLNGNGPSINYHRCLYCGQCVKACPTGTLEEGERGYRILVGGKLGRHPRLGTELPGIYAAANIPGLLECCLDHYQRHCKKGERFGVVLERTGEENLLKKEEKAKY